MLIVEAVNKLIQEFNKLPSIVPKSAQRLAYYLLRAPEEQAKLLAEAILAVKQKIGLCSLCFNVTDADLCPICRSDRRDGLATQADRVPAGRRHLCHAPCRVDGRRVARSGAIPTVRRRHRDSRLARRPHIPECPPGVQASDLMPAGVPASCSAAVRSRGRA